MIKRAYPAVFITMILVIMLGFFGLTGCGSKGPDFQSVYDDYCSSTWAAVGSDGSYLNIDTNPNNQESYYISSALLAIKNVNEALGLPESLYNDMISTNALMGRQTETFSSLGITVSWSYHPNNGLEVSYKFINE